MQVTQKAANQDTEIRTLTKGDYFGEQVTDTYNILEVWGPSGPRLLGCGPSGLLDFVLSALRALRPCDPRISAMME